MKPAYVAPIAAILVIVFVGAIIAIGYRDFRQKVSGFHQLMDPSKIVGKTPNQIISVYGKPAADGPDEYPAIKGHHMMLYSGPCWEDCFIDFTNDKAIAVHFGSH